MTGEMCVLAQQKINILLSRNIKQPHIITSRLITEIVCCMPVPYEFTSVSSSLERAYVLCSAVKLCIVSGCKNSPGADPIKAASQPGIANEHIGIAVDGEAQREKLC